MSYFSVIFIIFLNSVFFGSRNWKIAFCFKNREMNSNAIIYVCVFIYVCIDVEWLYTSTYLHVEVLWVCLQAKLVNRVELSLACSSRVVH